MSKRTFLNNKKSTFLNAIDNFRILKSSNTECGIHHEIIIKEFLSILVDGGSGKIDKAHFNILVFCDFPIIIHILYYYFIRLKYEIYCNYIVT